MSNTETIVATNENPTMAELFGEVISSYSRAEAIADGVLVDVSDTAREAGFRFPVAMTRAAFERYVTVPEGLDGLQDEAGRLWDVLWMLLCEIRRSRGGGSDLPYTLLVRNRGEILANERRSRGGLRYATLRSVCGPGDNGEPVVTIMLPDED